MIKRAVAFVDERLGAAPLIRKGLRYVFPDHWSFMLGEIALYSFVVLVGTGVFLTFYYVPSDETVFYTGTYEPLQGLPMGAQYRSVVDISFDVVGGNLMRQTHHWAANVFIAAIVLHLLRIILTGAYRKPREMNYWVGLTMLGLAIFNGFAGYSLVDDLYSGMGLVIAYAVAYSIPFVGADFAFLVWGGEYPGAEAFWPRLEITHVLIVPVLIGGLIGAHLGQIMRQHHTQFAGSGGTEKHVHGTPMWPGYALRSIGLFLVTTGVLFLLGGWIQINPIWLWGPYETWLSTNAAQPDWYLGWLIGGLRLMPPFEPHILGYTIVPNPFWGGLLFPTVVFVVLYSWPWIGRRWLGDDDRKHNVLDRPRDNPRRTAVLFAFLTWVFTVFVAGSLDRIYFRGWISYEAQIWFFRLTMVLLPVLAFFLVKRICEELKARETHPLRGWSGRIITRTPEGGFRSVPADRSGEGSAGAPKEEPSEEVAHAVAVEEKIEES